MILKQTRRYGVSATRLVRSKAAKALIVGAAISMTVSAVAHVPATPAAAASSRPAAAAARMRHWLEIGQASWYGLKFQGHKTATGEKYDMNKLTCAHRSLPLGSWIRVTNLRNRKSIFVRVNDRGPGPDNRIIDLSYAAAKAVGLDGVDKVKLETVTPGNPEMVRALVAQNHLTDLPGVLQSR